MIKVEFSNSHFGISKHNVLCFNNFKLQHID